MNFKAAIFDMDGLLLDTERVCKQIFEQACQAQQVPFLENVYMSIIGCNSTTIEQLIRQGYGPSLDYPALHDEWYKRYTDVVLHQAIPIKEGVIPLLDQLQSQAIPMAVATSTEKSVARVKLKLAGLDHYFTNITTGCEVSHGKPDPEIYLLAAKRLGVEPRECLAFEDSNNGIKAAIKAGMMAYQIPDLVQPNQEIVALGHSILPSLANVLELLEEPSVEV
ncbi:HAD family phosphatase [Vibrio profundum]|uniref:HAD family hydrolase n=1 Tax=Vibrio profundum TaxID=2910247 RepID=UPI003D09AA8B